MEEQSTPASCSSSSFSSSFFLLLLLFFFVVSSFSLGAGRVCKFMQMTPSDERPPLSSIRRRVLVLFLFFVCCFFCFVFVLLFFVLFLFSFPASLSPVSSNFVFLFSFFLFFLLASNGLPGFVYRVFFSFLFAFYGGVRVKSIPLFTEDSLSLKKTKTKTKENRLVHRPINDEQRVWGGATLGKKKLGKKKTR